MQFHTSNSQQHRGFIDNCLKSHTLCHQSTNLSSDQLPTRLLHLGDDDQLLYIRNSKDLPDHTKYAALSHCWGPNPIIRLLTENFDEYSCEPKGIPWEKLTQTFKDAILFARGLRKYGVEYLWVDSLCIIQDDKED